MWEGFNFWVDIGASCVVCPGGQMPLGSVSGASRGMLAPVRLPYLHPLPLLLRVRHVRLRLVHQHSITAFHIHSSLLANVNLH